MMEKRSRAEGGRPANRPLLPAGRFLAALLILSVLSIPAAASSGDGQASSLVPAGEGMTDFEARLALARVLGAREKNWAEAVDQYRILLAEQPENGTVRREMAEIFLWQKRYDLAQDELTLLLSRDPNDRGAALAMARLYLWRGDYGKAAALFESILSKGASPEVSLELARAYARSNRYDQAISAYREGIRSMGAVGPEIYGELADALWSAGRKDEALDHYRRAVLLDPSRDDLLKKLGLALSWSGRDDEALTVLEQLEGRMPGDREVGLELARLEVRRGEADRALDRMKGLLNRYPDDVEMTVEMADIEAGWGHAARCRDLYRSAIGKAPGDETLLLRFADRMVGWGDFYEAEGLYREHLGRHGQDNTVALKLALALVSSERYEEAEGLYRQFLLKTPGEKRILLNQAALRQKRKDFAGALETVERFLAAAPGDPEGMRLKAEALEGLGRHREALEAYGRASGDKIRLLIARGKIYRKLGEEGEASRFFEKALESAPRDAEARFYAAWERVRTDGFLKDLLEAKEPPAERTAWAGLYAMHGFNDQAILLYREALRTDPDYFPARIGLAETTGVDQRWDESIRLYEGLAAEFPGNSKIAIGLARVLAWARRYRESIDGYEAVRRMNPHDPVPQREKARVALWGKRYEESLAAYRAMLAPAVDEMLLERLALLAAGEGKTPLTEAYGRLDAQVRSGSLYGGYEAFAAQMEDAGRSLTAARRQEVGAVLAELLPAYEIQKAAFLEMEAKGLARDRRYARALETYEALVGFNPGNEEALFDLAQVHCALGLCDGEADWYGRLLEIDPLHWLARAALDRQQIRQSPAVGVSQSYWKETGRGDLAQITRYRTDVALEFPFWGRYRLSLTGHHWIENPQYTGGHYAADGFSLAMGGVINPYWRGEGNWTHKAYRDRQFEDRDSGYGRLWFNIRDALTLGIGYERTDEIANYFGIKQGSQADNWWLSASSNLTRRLEVNGRVRYLSYNDGNEGQHLSLGTGYAFTDHPGVFKVVLSGDYRDTRVQNHFDYDGSGTLRDIAYPYWTPRNVLSGEVTFEWRHDLSRLFFCGNELHVYDLRLSFGSESTGNPSVRLEGEWQYEFYRHWMVGLRGMLHRSREWDADSLWATVNYRF